MTLATLNQSLRRTARAVWKRTELDRAMRRLRALAPDALPGPELVAELRGAWDNDGFTADVDYLAEVARCAATTPGPVLECGSGLTTLLLGALAGRRGVEIWALEHDPRWHARIATTLKRHRLPGVRLRLVPLRDFGDFVWYDPPLPQLPAAFSLVVCDGPPDSTRGGRLGLLPVLGRRLAPGSLILLDDAARESERLTLERWIRVAPLRVESRTLPGGTLAVITRC